jgi:hypothetical protein
MMGQTPAQVRRFERLGRMRADVRGEVSDGYVL